MTGRAIRFWDNEAISRLAACKSDQLSDLARCLEEDPATFYSSAEFYGVDLRGQDLRGIKLKEGALDGALIDDTTIIDDPLGMFKFGNFDDMVHALNVQDLPLFGQRELLMQMVNDILRGVRLISLDGQGSSGKSLILAEVERILKWQRASSFNIPESLVEHIRGHPSIVFRISASSRSFSDALLAQILSTSHSAFQRRVLADAVHTPGLLQTSAGGLARTGKASERIQRLRRSSPSQRRNFVNAVLDCVNAARPEVAIVFMIDDADRSLDRSEVFWLIRSMPYARVLTAGRMIRPVDWAFDNEEETSFSSSKFNVASLSWTEARQVLEWAHARLRGAARFFPADGERIINLVGASPARLVVACRIGLAEALGQGRSVPLVITLRNVLDATARVYTGLLKRSEGSLADPTVSELVSDVVALEEALTRRDGSSIYEIPSLSSISGNEVKVFLDRLVGFGSARLSNNGRYRGTVAGWLMTQSES